MTANAEPAITPQIANHVLHFFKSNEGFSGGYVSDKFFELCAYADNGYVDRLALGFPEEIAAFRLAKQSGGIEMLRTIAKLPL